MTWVACAKTEDRKCIVHWQETEIGVSEGDGSEDKENSQLRILKVVYKIQTWGLLLRFLPSSAGAAGSIPGLGINIPHASRPKKSLRKK